MPYAQFDDCYDDHRKTKRAWRSQPAVVGLHAMAITYCNRHKTDGLVDADWIGEKLALLPFTARQRQAVLNTALELGMLEREGDDYRVHDFLQWNRSRAQREALAEQGRRGGHAKAAAAASPPDGDGSSPGSSPGSSHRYSDGQAPAKPGPSNGSSTPRHATPRQASNSNAELHSAVIEIFACWQERCDHRQAQLDGKRRGAIERCLRDRKRHHHGDLHAAVLDVRLAIDGAAIAPFIDAKGKRFDDIELICRSSSKLEDFMGRASLPQGATVTPLRGAKESASDLLRAINGGAA